MENIRIEGKGIISSGEYGSIKVDGLGNCNGPLKADLLNIDGKFKCTGPLTAGLVDCDGMAEFESCLSARKLLVDGYLAVKNGTKIEADEIICNGYIRVDGQVCADRIEAEGFISAQEIVGDQVYIRSRLSKFVRLFNFSKIGSQIALIEATTVELRGVMAQTVNGHNVTIGPNCEIDNLDCDGILTVSKRCIIHNLTGDYTMYEVE